MDGDGAQHGGRGAVLQAGSPRRGEERPLPRVVLLLHEVVAGPEGDELRVVRRRRDAHRARAADVGVAELVGHLLQVVRLEVVVVPQDVVVTRPTRALDALVRAQVEVELGGVGDAHVDGGAGGDVAWNDVATMRISFIQTS